MEKSLNKKKVLLMFSGGRDSFLAACRLIAKGYMVYLIAYDNGCISYISNAREVAQRIICRFGKYRVKYVGVHMIAQNILPLMQRALYSTPKDISSEYPDLLIYQLQCLACHTAMYLHSIAFCKANGIDFLAEGAREQQQFFVELPEMKQRYEALCKHYGLALLLPVFELDSDIQRKQELAEWGFLPKSYESQCWLGCPMKEPLTEPQIASLAKYYDNEILPLAQGTIDKLIDTKRFDVGTAGISLI